MPEHALDRSPQRDAPASARPAPDYAAIEAALAQHPRGRRFLAEYVRRSRSADTQMLLEAITKLEMAVLRPQRHNEPGAVLGELVAMSEAIARTRREIAQITPSNKLDAHLTNASEELDQVIEATEMATSDILQAAEEVQEVAWTLRERGNEVELCDMLDQRATDIYTACSFQDITGQRTAKVVQTLRFIEQRINAMIEIWGVDDIASRLAALESMAAEEEGRLINGPQPQGRGLRQDDIDAMLVARADHAKDEPSMQAAATDTQAVGALPTTEISVEAFKPSEPLTLAYLDAVKRAALFG
jgi:chemotaxis protein CheZ